MFCNNTHREPTFAEVFEGSSEVIDSVIVYSNFIITFALVNNIKEVE